MTTRPDTSDELDLINTSVIIDDSIREKERNVNVLVSKSNLLSNMSEDNELSSYDNDIEIENKDDKIEDEVSQPIKKRKFQETKESEFTSDDKKLKDTQSNPKDSKEKRLKDNKSIMKEIKPKKPKLPIRSKEEKAAEDWALMVEALNAFCEKHGHCNVPFFYETVLSNGKKCQLGFWLGTQRKYKKQGKLPAEHLAVLQAFVDQGKLKWSFRTNPLVQNPVTDAMGDAERWELMYTALVRYGEENSNCNVPHHIGFTLDEGGGENGPTSLVRLGFWLGTQRKYKKAGKLKPEYEARLQELVNEGKLKWSMRNKLPFKKKNLIQNPSSQSSESTSYYANGQMQNKNNSINVNNQLQAQLQSHIQSQAQNAQIIQQQYQQSQMHHHLQQQLQMQQMHIQSHQRSEYHQQQQQHYHHQQILQQQLQQQQIHHQLQQQLQQQQATAVYHQNILRNGSFDHNNIYSQVQPQQYQNQIHPQQLANHSLSRKNSL